MTQWYGSLGTGVHDLTAYRCHAAAAPLAHSTAKVSLGDRRVPMVYFRPCCSAGVIAVVRDGRLYATTPGLDNVPIVPRGCW
jgi:hypothetical protein